MAALVDDFQKPLSGTTFQVISFSIEGEVYGVDIAHVQEINRMVTITRVPQARPFMDGVINLRGRLIPIIDLRTRLGLHRIESTKDSRIIVTEIGTTRIGMVVDSVSQVLQIPVEQIENPPELIVGVDTKYIRGVGKLADGIIILLELNRIMCYDDAPVDPIP
jgi:purine-binding chemotaxis protein CheW